MKRKRLYFCKYIHFEIYSFPFLLILFFHFSAVTIFAQEKKPEEGYSVSKSLGVFVFPAKDQSSEQQNNDEFECYRWAAEQTGYDPMNPTKVEANQVDTGPDGSAVRGAARGAAVGLAIGAIAGDAGKGAAIGATSGAIAGRRGSRMHKAQQQDAENQKADSQNQKMIDDFNKAFSICLEAKGYTVSK
jgi:outer membrane lipoprotein SlyB